MNSLTHTFTNHHELQLFVEQVTLQNTQSLLIQFFDGSLDVSVTDKILSYLIEKFPTASIIGASTDGEILDSGSCSNTIVLSFTTFDNSQIDTRVISMKEGSFLAGERLGIEANSFDAKTLIVFSNPFNTNGDEFMNGISSVNSKTIVAGGLAGDNGAFKSTYVILGQEIYYDSAVAVLIKGKNLRVSNVYNFNWIPIGPSFTVTKSSGHEVYTLDNIPITQVYREYFGDSVANKLPSVGVAFPIIMHLEGKMVGRAPMMMLENGGIGFGGTVDEGTVIQFGIGNTQLILETSAITANKISLFKPEAIFIYSCMARRRYLGKSIDKEIIPLSAIAPVSGFFTYGEFHTDLITQQCSLLNETMTALILSESESSDKQQPITNAKQTLDEWSLITFNALSHLINKTSIDLQILNASLQRRVEEEIALNREKDKMMLTQSKQATMGEMISMIAHQWRQPIASIGLVCDNLALDVALNEINIERLSEATDLVHQQVQYLSKTIDDFSNYFRPDDTVKTFKVKDLYDELFAIIGKNLEHHSIKLLADFNDEDEISSNKRELLQVCLNLINNAKDAILEKKISNGWIRFLYRSYYETAQIRISDNAGGVDEKIADQIFDPYFSTKNKKHGSGLGLYMSKIIAHQHLKGDLVQNNETHGAVFIISIPLNNKG